jgi:hypothetical protein
MKHIITLKKFLLGSVIGALVILCGGCASNQMEQNFFDKEYDQAGTRFGSYPISDQIKIYLYGVQAVTPPVSVLSRPIAEHGQAAIPYIMGTLNASPTDQNIRDLMVIFETMQRLATYDVSNDKVLLRRLDGYVNGMTNKIWQGYTISKLIQIKQSNRDVD